LPIEVHRNQGRRRVEGGRQWDDINAGQKSRSPRRRPRRLATDRTAWSDRPDPDC
jgi:hypothetical protein